MIFEITRVFQQLEENDEITEILDTKSYRAELENGVFSVYETIENQEYKIIDQPFNFTDDNQRINWNSVEEGIEWFKIMNSDIGENNG
jgi:hypothetical protein